MYCWAVKNWRHRRGACARNAMASGALLLLEFMAKTGKTLNELIQEVYAITGGVLFRPATTCIWTMYWKNQIGQIVKRKIYHLRKIYCAKMEDIDGFKYHLKVTTVGWWSAPVAPNHFSGVYAECPKPCPKPTIFWQRWRRCAVRGKENKKVSRVTGTPSARSWEKTEIAQTDKWIKMEFEKFHGDAFGVSSRSRERRVDKWIKWDFEKGFTQGGLRRVERGRERRVEKWMDGFWKRFHARDTHGVRRGAKREQILKRIVFWKSFTQGRPRRFGVSPSARRTKYFSKKPRIEIE